ncbi:MAG TPA: sugar phosphate isomerase/epimerase [Rhizomicrobium sp.]|nr:sugar phosphate isomerase/epimerase [Rhizomicrobium sp.]
MTSRREFLAGAAAAFAAAPFASVPALAQRHLLLGLQLYTVRADQAKDYEGTLKQVQAAGVRKVQANLTMSGKTSQQQRKLYDEMGLIWESIHAGGDALRATPQATIDEAKAAGIKNITCSFPLYPADRAVIMQGPTVDDWKRNIEAFNKVGDMCKKSGLSFAYHNHNLEFRKIGEVLPYDLLLKDTDPALVSMEMDIGWVIAGGADPVAYLTKYPKRYSSVHIKDLKNVGLPNTNMKMTSAIIGQGIVDWGKVLPAVKKSSVTNAYLELEEPYDPSPVGMVTASAAYLKGKL